MISSSRVTACGFSILDITEARPRAIFLASATSSGPLDEGERDPVDVGIERGFEIGAVFRRQRGEGQHGFRQADALAVGQFAADLDAGDEPRSMILERGQAHLAIVEQKRLAGLGRLQDFRMRQVHAGGVAGRIVGIEREACRPSSPW